MFSTQKVGRDFIKQGTFVWYLPFLKISENHEKLVEKRIFIAQFHFQDLDSENEIGPSLAI